MEIMPSPFKPGPRINFNVGRLCSPGREISSTFFKLKDNFSYNLNDSSKLQIQMCSVLIIGHEVHPSSRHFRRF